MSEKNNSFNLTGVTPPIVDFIKLHGKTNIRATIDKITRDAGFGTMSSINYLALRGFNYQRHGQQQVHANRDNMGFTFFTRPILNLTYDNLIQSDRLAMLTSRNDKSYQRFVRATLDPWGQMFRKTGDNLIDKYHLKYGQQTGAAQELVADQNERGSLLVDECNPFIPLLSNTLTSLTGWKDVTLNDFESTAGYHNEKWSMVDGFFDVVDTFELSSDFRNIEGDPISLLFQTWEEYMVRCREGTMSPYPVFIRDREFDYNSRIYRFVMDPTRTYIQKWAATIAWPSSTPHGATFNFSADKNFSDAVSSIPVTWKCIGADYNNPKLFYEFNKLVEMYAPGLEIVHGKYDFKTNSLVIKGADQWIKLNKTERNRGNFFAIPLINYRTNELEWYVRKTDYLKYIYYPEEQQINDQDIFRRTIMPGEDDNNSLKGKIDPNPNSGVPHIMTA